MKLPRVDWRDAVEKDPHFAQSETPLLVGRAIAALAADPDVHRYATGSDPGTSDES